MTISSLPSPKALSKSESSTLQKELAEWQSNPPAGFKREDTDNLQRWIIEFSGEPDTLYANEKFKLQVDFPEHYPMKTPQVIFLSPVPEHPHIYSNGHICLGCLESVPAKPVRYVCNTILSMLSSSKVKQPPVDNDHYVRNCMYG